MIAMPPALKYTLGRFGLFAAVALVLLPLPIDLLVKLMIAVVVSAGLQFVVLKKWRNEMISQVDAAVARSRADKARLRAALAGEDGNDEPDDTAAASR